MLLGDMVDALLNDLADLGVGGTLGKCIRFLRSFQQLSAHLAGKLLLFLWCFELSSWFQHKSRCSQFTESM